MARGRSRTHLRGGLTELPRALLAVAPPSRAAGNQRRSPEGAVDVQIGHKGLGRTHPVETQPHDSKVFIHAACALKALCIRFGHSWARRALWATPDR